LNVNNSVNDNASAAVHFDDSQHFAGLSHEKYTCRIHGRIFGRRMTVWAPVGWIGVFLLVDKWTWVRVPYLTLPYLRGGCKAHQRWGLNMGPMYNPDRPHGWRNLL